MTSFTLTEQEEASAKRFITWHKRCRPNKISDEMPQYAPFQYIFKPLGIGNAVAIKCPYCGKVKDITDIDSW